MRSTASAWARGLAVVRAVGERGAYWLWSSGEPYALGERGAQGQVAGAGRLVEGGGSCGRKDKSQGGPQRLVRGSFDAGWNALMGGGLRAWTVRCGLFMR